MTRIVPVHWVAWVRKVLNAVDQPKHVATEEDENIPTHPKNVHKK